MITESIKKLLGEDLARQVEDALKGKGPDGADLDIVAGNDGSFVPAGEHSLAKGRVDAAEQALKTAAETLKDLGAGGDAKNLAADVLKLKGDFEALQTAHAAEMAKLQKTTAIKLGLGGNVHDPDDIISRLNLEEIELDENGGLKTGIDDLVKPIKEAKPYLFKEPQNPALRGAAPGQTGGGDGGDSDAQLINAAFGLKGE